MNKNSCQKYSDIKWYWNIPIVIMLTLLLSLGIRSLITDDNRYGWGTFLKQANYVIKYSYIKKDGSTHEYKPGNELIGLANQIRHIGSTRYSTGFIKHSVENYLKYLYRNKNDEEIKTFRAELYYVINKNFNHRFSKEQATLIELSYP